MVLSLATQLSNPKATIVYAAIFATFLPQGTTLEIGILIVILVFILETGWYALVTLAMSSEGPRLDYLRGKSWIDRLAGGVMISLGLRLALYADSPVRATVIPWSKGWGMGRGWPLWPRSPRGGGGLWNSQITKQSQIACIRTWFSPFNICVIALHLLNNLTIFRFRP